MTRVKVDAVEDAGNTTDAAVFVRYSTHPLGGVYTASSAFGGGGGSVTFSAGTSSGSLGSVVFSNSNNVSFGLNGSTITGSVLPPGGLSAGTASMQLGTVVFSNSNGVSFGVNGQTVTASHNGLTSQSNQAASASNGSFTFQTLNFSNANNVTFGTSAGGIVTASVVPGGGGGSITVSAGTSSVALASLVFADNGPGQVSFGLSGSTITASSPPFDYVGFSAGTSSAWLPTITFSNLNGVSFGLNGSTMTASVNAGGGSPVTFYAGGSSNTDNKISFLNTANVSWDLVNTTQIRATAYQNLSAGAASNNLTNVVFSNSNGVSFGLNGSTVTASASRATVSAGTASSALAGVISFSNANNVTFGLAGALGDMTITASVAAPGGGAAATVGHWPFEPRPIAMSTIPLGTSTTVAGPSTRYTVSMTWMPLALPCAVTFKEVRMPIAFSTVAGTGSVSMGLNVGLYSLTGNTFSRVSSWMWQANVSQNSVSAQTWSWWSGSTTGVSQSSLAGNVSASFTRVNDILLAAKTNVSTLTAGQYWLAAAYTRKSSNAAVWGSVSLGHYSVSQFTAAPIMGGTSSAPMLHPIHGIATGYTVDLSAINAPMLAASYATSIVNGRTASVSQCWPSIKFVPESF